MAATGILLLGTAPAIGQPDPGTAAAATIWASTTTAPVVSPVYAIPDTSPLLDTSTATAWAETWTPGYQPVVSSEVSPDGSARNGEGVSGSGGALHVAIGPAGLLPGGLALSAPVSSTRITSGFGWRLNPTGPGSYIHIGQDYGVTCGTPVRAAEDGTVVQSAWAGHSGQRVRVDHGSGVETAYSHNSLLIARVGDTVRRGDLLALSGTTGNSTGCHLHFEVYLNGKWVDPARYLPLLPGQSRPVTEQELQRIARTRALPTDHTAAVSSASPIPTPTRQGPPPPVTPSPSAADSDRTRKTPEPAQRQPRPQVPTTQAAPSAPAEPPTHPAPTTPAPTRPTAAQPTDKPTAPPSRTPSASPTETPEPPTTSATPTVAPAPTPSPTPANPAPSETPAPPTTSPFPAPTGAPDPTPTPETPSQQQPPASTPPSLAPLCLAYRQEHQGAASDPASSVDRLLSANEVAWLGSTLAATLPQAGALPEAPTVHRVATLCTDWFPQGIAQDTAPADLQALPAAPATTRKVAGTTK